MIPWSVHHPEDPEGTVSLVLGVSYPFLLVGPGAGETAPRWVRADVVSFGRVYFTEPWSAPFTSRPPNPPAAGA